MIKRLVISRLFNRMDFDLLFHEDINILTGRNGSGKTTVLKLIWYIVSGNIKRIFPEIHFEHLKLETDSFTVDIECRQNLASTKSSHQELNFTWSAAEGEPQHRKATFVPNSRSQPPAYDEVLDELEEAILSTSDSSVFFPTFRRIEGGFSIIDDSVDFVASHLLQQSLSELSDRLTHDNHRFVASISTEDIIDLLTERYADISKKTNVLHQQLTDFINKALVDFSKSNEQAIPQSEKLEWAWTVLGEIQSYTQRINEQSDGLLKPFTVLSNLITQIFQYKGIQVTDAIVLGSTEEAISSARLSAGEKQMFSFLTYNAFISNSYIFIDEPETSLHVDWQRQIFPILLAQSTGNQFIVSTHSPFIYSKFADKELLLGVERGDEAE